MNNAVQSVLATLLLLPVSHVQSQSWETELLGTLPKPLNLNGTIVHQNRLYTVGGDSDSGFNAECFSVELKGDGGTLNWRLERPLPYNLIYLGNAVVVHQGWLHIVGGQKTVDKPGAEYERYSHPKALSAKIQPDGTLGDWLASPEWQNAGDVGSAAVSDSRNLWVIGGLLPNNQSTTNAINKAQINEEGVITGWEESTPLPSTLHFHAAYHHNGSIFVAGGKRTEDNTSISNRVFRSTIAQDGTLTQWTLLPQVLPYPVSTGAGITTPQALFLIGGRTRDGLLQKIQYWDPSGTSSDPWSVVDTTIPNSFYSSGAYHQESHSLLIPGGRYTLNYMDIGSELIRVKLPTQLPIATPEPGTFASSLHDCSLDLPTARQLALDQNKTLLIVTMLPTIERSTRFAESLCTSEHLPADWVVGQLNIETHRDEARHLGILQVGILALISPDGSIQKRSTLPYDATWVGLNKGIETAAP
ncbi:MAG: hypothetical protein SFY68_14895 [Candidatus Sumerlaeia bacterium]|nr:hypothetical protein [Candidatus Sumerlaeia bacterium]